MARHSFHFSPAYRIAALPFGVTPRRAWLEVQEGLLRVRFGPWRLQTELTNVDAVESSGSYTFVKTAGPAHLSLADHGVTFASNSHRGICLTFKDFVRVEAPVGHWRCPGATVTPADPDAFLDDLRVHGASLD